MALREFQVSQHDYHQLAVALFGSICIMMSEHGYTLVPDEGRSARIAMVRIERNLDQYAEHHEVNDPEKIYFMIRGFAPGGKLDDIPKGVREIFAAFSKS